MDDVRREARLLRAALADLVSLTTLAADWDGQDAKPVLERVLDVVVERLNLEIAYLRVADAVGGALRIVRSRREGVASQATWRARMREIDRQLELAESGRRLMNPIGAGTLQLARWPLMTAALRREAGVLVTGAVRAEFPIASETMILSGATNLLSTILRATTASPPDVIPDAEWRYRERQNLLAALARAEGRVYGPMGAAALLGLKPSTLQSRLRSFGITVRGRS
jgi:hypothetical protein